MLAAAGATMIYAFRQAFDRYFAPLLRPSELEALGREGKDLLLIGGAAGGLSAILLACIGLPAAVDLGGAAVAAALTPRLVRSRRRARYVKDFDAALAESLQTVSASLKAGLTLKDSLFVACENSPPAFAREVALALREYRLGMPIEEALDNIRRRVKTPSCNIAFGAMIISSRLGGRLPEMLKRIVSTVRERERVEGKLRALTAQGRAQAFLLCAAPPALGLGMWLYDRSKMQLLTDYWVGQILLTTAIALEVIGILLTARVLRLEV
jgi:tight adherence protein B